MLGCASAPVFPKTFARVGRTAAASKGGSSPCSRVALRVAPVPAARPLTLRRSGREERGSRGRPSGSRRAIPGTAAPVLPRAVAGSSIRPDPRAAPTWARAWGGRVLDAVTVRPSLEAGLQSSSGLKACPPARRREREGGTPLATAVPHGTAWQKRDMPCRFSYGIPYHLKSHMKHHRNIPINIPFTLRRQSGVSCDLRGPT